MPTSQSVHKAWIVWLWKPGWPQTYHGSSCLGFLSAQIVGVYHHTWYWFRSVLRYSAVRISSHLSLLLSITSLILIVAHHALGIVVCMLLSCGWQSSRFVSLCWLYNGYAHLRTGVFSFVIISWDHTCLHGLSTRSLLWGPWVYAPHFVTQGYCKCLTPSRQAINKCWTDCWSSVL